MLDFTNPDATINDGAAASPGAITNPDATINDGAAASPGAITNPDATINDGAAASPGAITKIEKENIKFLFDYIQLNGSKNLSYLFRINFLKIDEVSSDYISIIYNCFQDLKKEIEELKQILKKLDFKGALYV